MPHLDHLFDRIDFDFQDVPKQIKRTSEKQFILLNLPDLVRTYNARQMLPQNC